MWIDECKGEGNIKIEKKNYSLGYFYFFGGENLYILKHTKDDNQWKYDDDDDEGTEHTEYMRILFNNVI